MTLQKQVFFVSKGIQQSNTIATLYTYSRAEAFTSSCAAVFIFAYKYDKDDRITQVQFGDTTHKVSYAYDGLGRIAQRVVTNGDHAATTDYDFVPGAADSAASRAVPQAGKIPRRGRSFRRAEAQAQEPFLQ